MSVERAESSKPLESASSDINDQHIFVNPMKMVKTVDDMQQWEKSEAYFEYLGFIYAINDAVKGKSNFQGAARASQEVNRIVDLLEKLSKWVDETPPISQPQRFGNQAFRTWYERLKKEAIMLLQSVMPENLHTAIPEIMVYMIEGFGNSTRIDYGTGHELSFVMFMCSLFKIGFLKKSDEAACACKIFVRYLELVRKLQVVYRMEPAGSHGVWSLDDYQFVPFIWGSSQFIGKGKFETNCFLQVETVNSHANDFMFLSCIQYINAVKKGPFAEHSNQLWSISSVSTWTKINGGLIRMYKAEVLAKFPLVQHIYFGSLFTLKPVDPGATVRGPKLMATLSGFPSQAQFNFKAPSATSKSKVDDKTAKSEAEEKETGASRISTIQSERSSSEKNQLTKQEQEAKSVEGKRSIDSVIEDL